jgi:hypothetical protein
MSAVRAARPRAYANTPIWSTEGGWGMNSQFSSTASDQRAFVARYDLQMLANGAARTYWYAYENTQWGTLWNGTVLTPAGTATGTLNTWLVDATLHRCSSSDDNLWTCDLTTSSGTKARIVWATTRAVWYSATGYSTVKTLDGGSTPASSGGIQAGVEPVMLS